MSKQTRSGTDLLRGIITVFRNIEDERSARSLHPLVNVLVMALCGVLSGCESLEDIEVFSEERKEFFGRFLDVTGGIPSESTFQRCLAMVRPSVMERALGSWLCSNLPVLQGQVLAADGKSLTGSAWEKEGLAPLHILHLWATEQRVLIAQKAVEGAPGEPSGLADLLQLLVLKGAVITGDANFCTTGNAAAVIAAEADYLFTLKGNRAALHSFVSETFAEADEAEKGMIEKTSHRTENVGHGRKEVRVVEAMEWDEWPLPDEAWPGLRTMVRVYRERTDAKGTSYDTSYALTSLPPDAAFIAHCLRQHWSVENQLHWILDICFHEDNSQITTRTLAENLAILRRVALSILQRNGGKKSIKAKRFRASLNQDYLLALLASS